MLHPVNTWMGRVLDLGFWEP